MPPIDRIGGCALQRLQDCEGGLDMLFEGGSIETPYGNQIVALVSMPVVAYIPVVAVLMIGERSLLFCVMEEHAIVGIRRLEISLAIIESYGIFDGIRTVLMLFVHVGLNLLLVQIGEGSTDGVDGYCPQLSAQGYDAVRNTIDQTVGNLFSPCAEFKGPTACDAPIDIRADHAHVPL